MKQVCEILVTKRSGQIVVGKITLEDGKLSVTISNKSFDRLRSIKEDKILIGSKVYEPKKDAKGWFKNLPKAYNGSHLRIRMVEDGNTKTDRSKKAGSKAKG